MKLLQIGIDEMLNTKTIIVLCYKLLGHENL